MNKYSLKFEKKITEVDALKKLNQLLETSIDEKILKGSLKNILVDYDLEPDHKTFIFELEDNSIINEVALLEKLSTTTSFSGIESAQILGISPTMKSEEDKLESSTPGTKMYSEVCMQINGKWGVKGMNGTYMTPDFDKKEDAQSYADEYCKKFSNVIKTTRKGDNIKFTALNANLQNSTYQHSAHFYSTGLPAEESIDDFSGMLIKYTTENALTDQESEAIKDAVESLLGVDIKLQPCIDKDSYVLFFDKKISMSRFHAVTRVIAGISPNVEPEVITFSTNLISSIRVINKDIDEVLLLNRNTEEFTKLKLKVPKGTKIKVLDIDENDNIEFYYAGKNVWVDSDYIIEDKSFSSKIKFKRFSSSEDGTEPITLDAIEPTLNTGTLVDVQFGNQSPLCNGIIRSIIVDSGDGVIYYDVDIPTGDNGTILIYVTLSRIKSCYISRRNIDVITVSTQTFSTSDYSEQIKSIQDKISEYKKSKKGEISELDRNKIKEWEAKINSLRVRDSLQKDKSFANIKFDIAPKYFEEIKELTSNYGTCKVFKSTTEVIISFKGTKSGALALMSDLSYYMFMYSLPASYEDSTGAIFVLEIVITGKKIAEGEVVTKMESERTDNNYKIKLLRDKISEMKSSGRFNDKDYAPFEEKISTLELKTFSDITNESKFRDYANNLMKEVQGDSYSKEVTDKVVDDLIKDNPKEDYGQLVGRLKSGLGNRSFSLNSSDINKIGKTIEDMIGGRSFDMEDFYNILPNAIPSKVNDHTIISVMKEAYDALNGKSCSITDKTGLLKSNNKTFSKKSKFKFRLVN